MCLFLESSGTVCQWDVELQTLNEMCVKVTIFLNDDDDNKMVFMYCATCIAQ